MELAAFYHVWTRGAWRQPWVEFHVALDDAQFPSQFVLVNQSDADSEAPTINAVREYAQDHGGAVLYAHTKGAAENTEFRARWRRSMTRLVIGRWRENLALLESGDVDAVGCHWLTEDQFPGMFGPQTIPAEGSGFFGGNFWMARCDYLRTLPPCPAEPRWEAESWIGRGSPRVVDLLPGWPDDNRWPDLCGKGA